MANVYSVSQINSYISNMFAQDVMLGHICIRGEISNYTDHYKSGHLYFTIKDEDAAINCIMYSFKRNNLTTNLRPGMSIIAVGSVQVYKKNGTYSFIVDSLRVDGIGSLTEEYERLRQELLERGMFDPMYKQPIPKYVKTLGVVTAPTGAAIRDIITVSKRRNPYIKIILYPALVQGENAPQSIVSGIRALEQYGVDCMIVGRGGGSIEDLWGFNSELVAEAIFECSVPIISAVGHETDTTIADWVSDMRAATPSAAAELAVADIFQTVSKLDSYQDVLQSLMQQKITGSKYQLSSLSKRLKDVSYEGKLVKYKADIAESENRLRNLFNNILVARQKSLMVYAERLKGLSPLEKLSQGYSYVSTSDGKTLSDIEQVKKDDEIEIYVQNGKITAGVMEVQSINYGRDNK